MYRIYLSVFVALICAIPRSGSAEGTRAFSISGGSIAGVYFHIAEELCRFVNQQAEKGKRCHSRSGFGSAFNINALENGLIEFGLAQSDLQWNAWNGVEEWSDGPVRNIRSVASLHEEAVHLIAREAAGIQTIADLKGHNISVGNRASGQRKNALTVLDLYDLDLKRDLSASGLLQGKALQKLTSGELDAFFYTVGFPSHSIVKLSETVPLDFLDIKGDLIWDFMKEKPSYQKMEIPAHTYAGQEEVIYTFGARSTLLASTHVSDDLVYELLTVLYAHFDELTDSHPSLIRLKETDLSRNLTVPLHPGAIKFYRDKGLLAPSVANNQ